ncbi:MAG: FAD-dependent oxidoreductase [Paracoccaceae bacterium]|nr:FAD-dependent oxidoreductase [Paracoccaceae bacterium]
MNSAHSDVVIVGGGLSGLAVARGLSERGIGFTLLEARDRLGGRILGETCLKSEGRFDMGPAWIWPHNQRLLALIQDFDLRLYNQYGEGRLVFEDANGHLRRDLEFATMGDALRIKGGSDQLIHGLSSSLCSQHIHLKQEVTQIDRIQGGLQVQTASGMEISARRVVLALPPRLWSDRIRFTPDLPSNLKHALAAIPTWMAGHTKVVATYEHAFWRDAGFSGDAISHIGPLTEIHDATDEMNGAAALFGFVGVSDRHDIRTRAIEQLVRLFGVQAGTPGDVFVKDWASDPMTAVPQDQNLPREHPIYLLPSELGDWAGTDILVAGTETAPGDGGFLEGALEAAETVLARLSQDQAP